MKKKLTLEEANEIAIKYGYHTYGELHSDLYRHGITLEQFIKNGYSFERKPAKEKKADKMPESVFNAITKRIIDLEDQTAALERAKGNRLKAEITSEKKRIQVEIRELKEYQKAHYR